MLEASQNRTESERAELTWLGLGLHRLALPEPGELVIVQCRGYRCLAYYDNDRKWRNVKTAREIVDVSGWWNIGDDTFTPLS
jgi:hypothetical protein